MTTTALPPLLVLILVGCSRWWWIKLKALVELKDWEGLDAFAKSKKSPIGYEPFVVSMKFQLIGGTLSDRAPFVGSTARKGRAHKSCELRRTVRCEAAR